MSATLLLSRERSPETAVRWEEGEVEGHEEETEVGPLLLNVVVSFTNHGEKKNAYIIKCMSFDTNHAIVGIKYSVV